MLVASSGLVQGKRPKVGDVALVGAGSLLHRLRLPRFRVFDGEPQELELLGIESKPRMRFLEYVQPCMGLGAMPPLNKVAQAANSA